PGSWTGSWNPRWERWLRRSPRAAHHHACTGCAARPERRQRPQRACRGRLHFDRASIRPMVARNRLPPWHEEIRLGNGRDVLVRPIRPEDAPVLRASFELMQPEDVRAHVLGGGRAMSVELSHQLAHPDARNEFTLVVSEQLPPGEAM